MFFDDDDARIADKLVLIKLSNRGWKYDNKIFSWCMRRVVFESEILRVMN